MPRPRQQSNPLRKWSQNTISVANYIFLYDAYGDTGDLFLNPRVPKVFKMYKRLVCWLFLVFTMYVALAIFQPYHDLEAGDNQSLKS